MKEPILVIMAAGIGSRYGGLKQMDAIGPGGELIIDYSIYDAIEAGFKKVVFIINRKIEKEFKEIIGHRLNEFIDVNYAFQEITDVPDEVHIPKERIKPWGTAHAIYSARNYIDAPFAVINADDYYGKDAFYQMYKALKSDKMNMDRFVMVGYQLKNTVTEHGYVSRGVCKVNEYGILEDVVERARIEMKDGELYYVEEEQWTKLDDNQTVSMNMWGFTTEIIETIGSDIADFLNEKIEENPLKCEYYLPYVVNQMVSEQKIKVDVLSTKEKWYGVTYKDDKEKVVNALNQMVDAGRYPSLLWKNKELKKISQQFKLKGQVVLVESYGDGHINDTYKIVCENEERKTPYILQRVNHTIFTNVEGLMTNIENVTNYLNDLIRDQDNGQGYEVLTLISTVDNKSYYKDGKGNYYRVYEFVMNATGHTFATDNKMLYEAGVAFGRFQTMLKDFPADILSETIEGFHHTMNRYNRFIEVVDLDSHRRCQSCQEEIEFVMNRKSLAVQVVELLESGALPLRVTHNDTKINNVLLDNETGEGRCVIDLDTVMPGSALYDFGDAIRSSASQAKEDEEDLSLVLLDLQRFEAYTKGYLQEVKEDLWDKEKELLKMAGILLTFECGMRFLTDYLEGDVYFKIHKPEHNLIRAKNQFKFVEEMENRIDEIDDVINKYL